LRQTSEGSAVVELANAIGAPAVSAAATGEVAAAAEMLGLSDVREKYVTAHGVRTALYCILWPKDVKGDTIILYRGDIPNQELFLVKHANSEYEDFAVEKLLHESEILAQYGNTHEQVTTVERARELVAAAAARDNAEEIANKRGVMRRDEALEILTALSKRRENRCTVIVRFYIGNDPRREEVKQKDLANKIRQEPGGSMDSLLRKCGHMVRFEGDDPGASAKWTLTITSADAAAAGANSTGISLNAAIAIIDKKLDSGGHEMPTISFPDISDSNPLAITEDNRPEIVWNLSRISKLSLNAQLIVEENGTELAVTADASPIKTEAIIDLGEDITDQIQRILNPSADDLRHMSDAAKWLIVIIEGSQPTPMPADLQEAIAAFSIPDVKDLQLNNVFMYALPWNEAAMILSYFRNKVQPDKRDDSNNLDTYHFNVAERFIFGWMEHRNFTPAMTKYEAVSTAGVAILTEIVSGVRATRDVHPSLEDELEQEEYEIAIQITDGEEKELLSAITATHDTQEYREIQAVAEKYIAKIREIETAAAGAAGEGQGETLGGTSFQSPVTGAAAGVPVLYQSGFLQLSVDLIREEVETGISSGIIVDEKGAFKFKDGKTGSVVQDYKWAIGRGSEDTVDIRRRDLSISRSVSYAEAVELLLKGEIEFPANGDLLFEASTQAAGAAGVGTTDPAEIENRLAEFVTTKTSTTILLDVKNVGLKLYRNCIVEEFVPGERIAILHNGETVTHYISFVAGVPESQNTCLFKYVGTDDETVRRQKQQAIKERALVLAESGEAADSLAKILKDEHGLAYNNILRQVIKDPTMSSVQAAIYAYQKTVPGGVVFVTEAVRKLLPSYYALLIGGIVVYSMTEQEDVNKLQNHLLLNSV